MRCSTLLAVCLLAVISGWAETARAQSAENVAVVINDSSKISQRIGEHYVNKRSIPAANVIRIQTADAETIERPAYATTIEQPIVEAFVRGALQDRILYIVLTKGVPLRIAGTGGPDGTVGSVDSELALIYRRLTGENVSPRGRIDNPYFLGNRDLSEAQPFSHRDQDIYLVTRLDAFTEAEALGLIDRALKPSTDGRIVLDQRDALTNRVADEWLGQAARLLAAQGHGDRVTLESTVKPVRDISQVLGYYSWGSTDPQNRVRSASLRFVPGGIAATYVGTDGRTLREPPAKWQPMENWGNRITWFGGSPQSLIGDLIRDGVTGTAGHVSDPRLQGAVRPDILFPAYLAGFNLAEAFYLATPQVSSPTIVIGDPLCRPFAGKVLTRADLEKPTDPVTELPGFFSARRLAQAVAVSKARPEAVAHALRAENRLAHKDTQGARKAFEQAAAADPGFASAHLQLALLVEAAGEYDLAFEHYRQTLKAQPNSVLALNNLAYGLAVHKKQPAEAKPLAERAVTLAAQDPSVVDTLGWIEYLLGNHAEAVKHLAAAARAAPGNADIHLHAAFAYAASGLPSVARRELDQAVKLQPALAERDDVRELRSRIEQK